MPASLYRLVGKPHHAEVTQPAVVHAEASVQNDAVVPVVADIVTATSEVESSVNDVAIDANAASTDEAVADEANDAVVSYPAWDPNWSKTQLLTVASQLGLNVTSANTKNEIIKALTNATSV